MNPDEQLNELFRVAREEKYEPRALGFETRLRANLRAARGREPSVGWLAWRVAPVFAAITVAAGCWFLLGPDPEPNSEFASFDLDPQALVYLTASR